MGHGLSKNHHHHHKRLFGDILFRGKIKTPGQGAIGRISKNIKDPKKMKATDFLNQIKKNKKNLGKALKVVKVGTKIFGEVTGNEKLTKDIEKLEKKIKGAKKVIKSAEDIKTSIKEKKSIIDILDKTQKTIKVAAKETGNKKLIKITKHGDVLVKSSKAIHENSKDVLKALKNKDPSALIKSSIKFGKTIEGTIKKSKQLHEEDSDEEEEGYQPTIYETEEGVEQETFIKPKLPKRKRKTRTQTDKNRLIRKSSRNDLKRKRKPKKKPATKGGIDNKKPVKTKTVKGKRKPSKYNLFVKQQRKKGKTMTEIGKLWRKKKITK
jgi:hypothetical protein